MPRITMVEVKLSIFVLQNDSMSKNIGTGFLHQILKHIREESIVKTSKKLDETIMISSMVCQTVYCNCF